jgi:hypothetical protein
MPSNQLGLRSLGTSRTATAIKQGILTVDGQLTGMLRTVGWRRRRSVLFEVYSPFGFDGQEPVIRCLVQRGNLEVHLSGAAERGAPAPRVAALTRRGVHQHSLAATRHRRFDAVVVTDKRLVNSWRSARYAYLHHGSALGNRPDPYVFELLESGDVDYVLALHPAEAAAARARFGDRLDGRVAVTGQPKLDRLATPSGQREAMLRELGLDPARRTVLFLSHWTAESLLHAAGESILAALRLRTELNVLVTAHHHVWDHPARSGGIDWRDRLAWIADQPHMRLLPQPTDLLALMLAADIAVGDHTSAVLEYAFLYRPIVLFRHPKYQFSDPALEQHLQRNAHVFRAPEGFAHAFEAALGDGEPDRTRRKELLDHCFYDVGGSGLRAAIAVEQLATSGRFATYSG